MHRTIQAIAILLAALTAACDSSETPEDRVRAFVEHAAEAAEARSWMSFRDYVSDDYSDARGLAKDQIMAVITRYILANQRIYVLKRIADIKIDGPNRASAVVYAALAGRPLTEVDDLTGITADLYRFEIELAAGDDGKYQVIRGDWYPIQAQDFFLGD